MLTTVDGSREPTNNGSRRVKYLESITKKTYSLVDGNSASSLSKGGMTSKLKAAGIAAHAGCTVVIANGRKAGVLNRIMAGEDTGTMVLASGV